MKPEEHEAKAGLDHDGDDYIPAFGMTFGTLASFSMGPSVSMDEEVKSLESA